MMTRFKVLSVLILICIVVCSVQQMIVNVSEGFRTGYQTAVMAGERGKSAESYIMLDLFQQEMDSSSLFTVKNEKTGEMIYLIPDRASLVAFNDSTSMINGSDMALRIVNDVLNLIIIILYIAFFVLFLIIIITFSRARVFEERNIKRLNWIGFGFLVIGVLSSIWQVIRIYIARGAVELSAYNIGYARALDWDNIIMGLIILIMTEILRMAIGLKREQELTI